MQLVDIPDNPLPPNGIVAMITARRAQIRVARWAATGAAPCPGTVVVCPGRTEYIEKYAEVVSDLLARGFAVVVLDWRGQGGSSRPLRNPRKGHVRSFREYERDLEAVGASVLEPHCPKPWFALAHSMGGTILLHHARRPACLFERIVLSAPMIDIFGLSTPKLARTLASAASRFGFGTSFVPGGTDHSIVTKPFAGNVLTSDERRFAAFAALARAAPTLLTGSPTWAWLRAAFRAMAPFETIELPRRIAVPTLVVACGGDRVCDTAATERFATRLKAGRLIVVPHAEHEILMEQDRFRDQFWAAFDAFVPGTAVTSYSAEPTQQAAALGM